MSAYPKRLVLGSGSQARQRMLRAAGVAFDVVPAVVDEPGIRNTVVSRTDGHASPAEIANALAAAKALEVSNRLPDALVIGADQVLDCGGDLLSKPLNEAGVRATLAKLAGRTHELHSSVVLATAGEIIWTDHDSAALSMRSLDEDAINWYVGAAGEDIFHSVGAYHIEGLGIRLFESVAGDHFTILGMPLLPLLAKLRQLGAVP